MKRIRNPILLSLLFFFICITTSHSQDKILNYLNGYEVDYAINPRAAALKKLSKETEKTYQKNQY